jgi:hypothetical protein
MHSFDDCEFKEIPLKIIKKNYTVSRVEGINGRYYTKNQFATKSVREYPSITSVLSGSTDTTWLQSWWENIGYDNAERITRRSSNRGTQLHKMCENYLSNVAILNTRGENYDIMPESISMFKSMLPWLNSIQVVYGCEVKMVSSKLKVGGTTDCIGIYNGKLAIIDFKNSRRHKTLSQIKDYILQEAAYAAMAAESIVDCKIESLVTMIAVEGEKLAQVYEVPLTSDIMLELVDRIKQYNEKRLIDGNRT